MAPVIRERAGKILDGLPIGEEFDWVDLVSKELTAMTLATLFDFPFEDRRKLTYWSDMMTNPPGIGPVKSWEQKRAEIDDCFAVFTRPVERAGQRRPPKFDLISMLAHGEATRDMDGRISRQRRPADHRRQRHHPQHHLRLGLRAEQAPGPVRQAARRSRR